MKVFLWNIKADDEFKAAIGAAELVESEDDGMQRVGVYDGDVVAVKEEFDKMRARNEVL